MKIQINQKEMEKYRNTRAYAVGHAAGYNLAMKIMEKTTRWKRTNAGYICERCGAMISFHEFHRGNHHFCHVCGAKASGGA